MIQISDIRDGKTRAGKEYTGFVCTFFIGREALKSRGWRWWAESDTVQPPSAQMGKGWFKTQEPSDALLAAIETAFREARVDAATTDATFASEVWEQYRAVRESYEIDEAIAEFGRLSSMNKHQQGVRLLLEVAANPKSHTKKSATEVLG